MKIQAWLLESDIYATHLTCVSEKASSHYNKGEHDDKLEARIIQTNPQENSNDRLEVKIIRNHLSNIKLTRTHNSIKARVEDVLSNTFQV